MYSPTACSGEALVALGLGANQPQPKPCGAHIQGVLTVSPIIVCHAVNPHVLMSPVTFLLSISSLLAAFFVGFSTLSSPQRVLHYSWGGQAVWLDIKAGATQGRGQCVM